MRITISTILFIVLLYVFSFVIRLIVDNPEAWWAVPTWIVSLMGGTLCLVFYVREVLEYIFKDK